MRRVYAYFLACTHLLTHWPISCDSTKSVEAKRLGSVYGGGYAIADMLDSDSIVYSIGVGEEISFDQDLSKIAQSHIYGIDPTPRAITFINECDDLPTNYSLIPIGLGVTSGVQRFFYPAESNHVSMSLVHDSGTGYIDCQFLTLSDLMVYLGYDYVNLIKIDIEGAEFELLDKWLKDDYKPPSDQIWIEFHPKRANKSKEDSQRIVRQLSRMGFLALYDGQDGYLLCDRGLFKLSLRGIFAMCYKSGLMPVK